SGAAVLKDAGDVYLVLTPSDQPLERVEGASHVRFNFVVPDLDRAVASMESAGVHFAGKGRSAVGRYATFVDPSGHTHNLKELFEPRGDAHGGPRVYNAAITVPNMVRARAFYEGVLGFAALSEDYYPPVVPMKPAGSTMFILSDRQTRTPSVYDYEAGAFAGLAFETSDVAAMARRLREAGVEFLHDAPVDVGPVILMAFRDPFGNVHELIQHTDTSTGSPLDELAFLVGTWRGTLGGTPIEEIWSAPDGNHMLGMLRWLNAEGRPRMFEIFTISDEDEGFVYRLRHFDGELQPWATEAEGPKVFLISAIEGRLVRLEPLRGVEGIDRATYDASQDGRLVFTIEFSEETGRDTLVIEFERQ
ncbi:MAG: DUF6265 family protein, partial [Planctomycetota bacterium]